MPRSVAPTPSPRSGERGRKSAGITQIDWDFESGVLRNVGKDKPFRLGYVNDLGYTPNQIAQLQNLRVGLGYGNLPLALHLAGVGQTDGLPTHPPVG